MFMALALMVACGGNAKKGGESNEVKGFTMEVNLEGIAGVEPGAEISIVVMGEKEPAAKAILGEDKRKKLIIGLIALSLQ